MNDSKKEYDLSETEFEIFEKRLRGVQVINDGANFQPFYVQRTGKIITLIGIQQVIMG